MIEYIFEIKPQISFTFHNIILCLCLIFYLFMSSYAALATRPVEYI